MVSPSILSPGALLWHLITILRAGEKQGMEGEELSSLKSRYRAVPSEGTWSMLSAVG